MKQFYIYLTLCSITIQGQYQKKVNANNNDVINLFLDENQRSQYASNDFQQANTFTSPYVSQNAAKQHFANNNEHSSTSKRESSEIPMTPSTSQSYYYDHSFYNYFDSGLTKTDPKPSINSRDQFLGDKESQNFGSQLTGTSAQVNNSASKSPSSGDFDNQNVRQKGQIQSVNNNQDITKYPADVKLPNTEAGYIGYLRQNLQFLGEVERRNYLSLLMQPNIGYSIYKQIADDIKRHNEEDILGLRNNFGPGIEILKQETSYQYIPSNYNSAQAVQATHNQVANQSNNKNNHLFSQDSVNGNINNQYQTSAVNRNKIVQTSESPKYNYASLLNTTTAPSKSSGSYFPTTTKRNPFGYSNAVTNNIPVLFDTSLHHIETTTKSNFAINTDPFPVLNDEEFKKKPLNYQQQLNNFGTVAEPNISNNNYQLLQHGQNIRIKGEELNPSVAIGNFGVNIIKSVRQPKPNNWVISPVSITLVLALLQQGAVGDTQFQLSAALGMSADVTATACKTIAEDIKLRRGQNILNIVNSIFGAYQLNLNKDFANKVHYNFGSEIFPIDFYDNVKAASKINRWVSNRTNNKINSIVSGESISPFSQLVFVNAMYFKGVWQTKFRPETTLNRDFYLNNVEKKTVPFLRARRAYKNGVDSVNRVQVAILPFEQEQYSMMVLLPQRGVQVDDIIPTLTYAQLAEYHNYPPTEVDLELPKFSIRSDTNLAYLLKLMNVTKIFSTESDLSGIGYYGTFPAQVTSAIHTAQLAIDEEGGTAEAATVFSVVALSYATPASVFKANRPFISIVWDTNLAIPLFIARIEDPS